MKRMEIKGIDFAFVTMHAGLGNFREIDVEESHQFIALHVFSLLTPQHFRLPSSVFSLLL